jgi:hypothetical protein
MNITEIRDKIPSNDLAILKQSLIFVNEKITNERVRASKAETRATATLAFAGVFSSIVIVKLPSTIRDFVSVNLDSISYNWLLFFSLYAATVLFLLKSALFSFKALGVLRKNEVSPDFIFDIQEKCEYDALREEITYKIWEYYELIPVGNRRLFLVNRAQRNILASIVVFSALGISQILFENANFLITNEFIIFVVSTTAAAIFLLDFVVEKCNNFWH